jgi:hypothetical protein
MADEPHELAELSGAYALDALDELERRRFEAHLATCPSCRAEVAAFHDVAAALGETVGAAPPPALRGTVLAAAARSGQDLPPTVVGTPSGRPEVVAPARGRRNLLPVAGMAAAAALVVGVLANELLETRDRLARATSVQSVLAAADARSWTLSGDGVSGRLVTSPSAGRSVLVAGGLPTPTAGRAYTLWLIRDDAPVAVHQFGVDDPADAVELVSARVDGYDAAGVTEEAAADTLPAAPTGPLLLHGDLCAECG